MRPQPSRRCLGAQVIASGGRLGPGGARNRGAAIARGANLWFVDADVVVHDDAAAVLACALADDGVTAVFGTYDSAPAAPGFLSQYRNLLHRHHHMNADPEARRSGPAAAPCARPRSPASAGSTRRAIRAPRSRTSSWGCACATVAGRSASSLACRPSTSRNGGSPASCAPMSSTARCHGRG
jgi:hypothetical protein